MLASTLLIAALTLPTDSGQHPYDIALEYCNDKGGLAQYSVNGNKVEFSCGDEPATLITITQGK